MCLDAFVLLLGPFEEDVDFWRGMPLPELLACRGRNARPRAFELEEPMDPVERLARTLVLRDRRLIEFVPPLLRHASTLAAHFASVVVAVFTLP